MRPEELESFRMQLINLAKTAPMPTVVRIHPEPSITDHNSNVGVEQKLSSTLEQEIQLIRKVLQLNCNPSVDYEFVRSRNERVYKQLIKDNILMENCHLSNEVINPIDKFQSFCVYAFYQLEELLNFHFFSRFNRLLNAKDLSDLKAHLIRLNPNPHENTKKTINNARRIGDINVGSLLIAFNTENYVNEGNSLSYNLIAEKIRSVRNQYNHRCSVLVKNSEQALRDYLEKFKQIPDRELDPENKSRKREGEKIEFLKESNYSAVRNCLIDFAEKIKSFK